MRQPKPWCRASKNAWYVGHHFRQHRLGEHPDVCPPPQEDQVRLECPAGDPRRLLQADGHRPGQPAQPGDDRHPLALRPVPRPQPQAPQPGLLRELPPLPPIVLRRLRPPPGRRSQAVPRDPVARRPPGLERRPLARRHRRRAGLLLGRPAGHPDPEPAPDRQGRAGPPPDPRADPGRVGGDPRRDPGPAVPRVHAGHAGGRLPAVRVRPRHRRRRSP